LPAVCSDAKSTREIHEGSRRRGPRRHADQRLVGLSSADRPLDIVFSLDSVITAWGWRHLRMIAAVVLRWRNDVRGRADQRLCASPSDVKMLALSFLLMIGVHSSPTGWASTLPRLHLFRDGFSVFVEMLNSACGRARLR